MAISILRWTSLEGLSSGMLAMAGALAIIIITKDDNAISLVNWPTVFTIILYRVAMQVRLGGKRLIK